MEIVEELCDRVIVMQAGSVIVDESVSAMVEAFDTQTYRFRCSTTLSPDTRSCIESVCSSVDWTRRNRTEMTATLSSPTQLYELMDELRRADVAVESIETEEPDLEEAFLQATESQQKINERS